jgi:hypothetical protein
MIQPRTNKGKDNKTQSDRADARAASLAPSLSASCTLDRHVPAMAAMASRCRLQTPYLATSSPMILSAANSQQVNQQASAGDSGPDSARRLLRSMEACLSGDR